MTSLSLILKGFAVPKYHNTLWKRVLQCVQPKKKKVAKPQGSVIKAETISNQKRLL